MNLHHDSGRWRLGVALCLVTVSMWGVEPIALTVTLQAIDVYTLGWMRFLVCFILLAGFLGVRQQLPTVKQLRAASWSLLAIAIIFLGINYVLFLEGLARTSPSTGQVLIQLAPIFMGLGALVLFKERYSLRQWCGLGILTLGFILFFHEKLQSAIADLDDYLLGSSFIVLSAAAWAVYALAQKQLLRTLSSVAILAIIYGVCAILLTPLATPQILLKLDWFYWGMLGICILNTLIAYGAFAEALAHLEASKVSAILPLSPIVTLIVMPILLIFEPTWLEPEHLTALGVLGAILVVSGSMTIALEKKVST